MPTCSLCCALFFVTVVGAARIDDAIDGSSQPLVQQKQPQLKQLQPSTLETADHNRIVADRDAMDKAVKATAFKSKSMKADAAALKAAELKQKKAKEAIAKHKIALAARLAVNTAKLPWRNAMAASAKAASELKKASLLVEESTASLVVATRIEQRRLDAAKKATKTADTATTLAGRAKEAMDMAFEDYKKKAETQRVIARQERTAAEEAKELTIESVIANKDREEKFKEQNESLHHSNHSTEQAFKASKDSIVIDHVAVAAALDTKLANKKLHLATAKAFGDVKDGTVGALKRADATMRQRYLAESDGVVEAGQQQQEEVAAGRKGKGRRKVVVR